MSYPDQSNNQGYPPQQGGYPPYPQPQGYGPPQGGYGPPQGGYGPPPQGYGPPPGYPPQPPGSYPQPYPQPGHGGYPPPQGGGYGQPPITSEYGGGMPPSSGWMTMPQGPPNCPPGLEYLTLIDQLIVKQKIELLEVITGFETNNKFSIKNSLGQKIYYAVEDNDCCTRNCCGPLRPFEMKILDNYGNQVISLNRPLACDSCLFPCCLQSIEVSAPPGNVVGTVQQEWTLCMPSFTINNPSGDTILRIEGPFCTFSFCGDVEFQVMSADGKTQVGKISKHWSGLIREAATDSDNFGITFPMDLDVRMKAVMLGACFLIDAMFFEKSGSNN